VARIVAAAWRARRADRGHGPRALQTLIRYGESVLAGLFRALAALETLRAQRRATKTQIAKIRAGRRKTKQTRESAPKQ
jgi:hypothetical protein